MNGKNNKMRLLCVGVFLATCLMATPSIFAAQSKKDNGIEWPPYSEMLDSGPRAGFFPHTGVYVSMYMAPEFIKKGMAIFSVPDIWYEKGDTAVLTMQGKILKDPKRQIANGRVCDAVVLGINFEEGNHWLQCVDEMLATDKFYFRKDDPVLTGAKIRKEAEPTADDIDDLDKKADAFLQSNN